MENKSKTPESWEDEFDRKFLTRFQSIFPYRSMFVRSIKSFISQTLATEKAKWMKEWREKIEGMGENIRHHHDKEYAGCPRCIEIRANNWVVDDIIKLTTPSEQEER